jgi:hypothetical protein
MKNISKYETLEQLKLRFNKRVATTDEETQYINRCAESSQSRDSARDSNQFFCKYFTAHFVVREDNTSELIPIFDNFNAGQDFSPKAYHICGHSAKTR